MEMTFGPVRYEEWANSIRMANTFYNGHIINILGVDPNMIANNLLPYELTHPGELLQEELMARNIDPVKLAEITGMPISQISDLLNCKLRFTIDFALMLESFLGIDADLWMRLQYSYEKETWLKDLNFMAKIANIRKNAEKK